MEHLPEPRPRFLLPKARRGDGFGYTTLPPRPIRDDSPAVRRKIAEARTPADEPEVLEKGEWERHIGKRNERTAEQMRTAEEIARDRDRRLLSQEERIAKAQAEAQAKRRDVKREMWTLRQMQSQGRKPDLMEKQVQKLERIAYLNRAA